MTDRERILGKLRATQRPFQDIPEPQQRYHMVPQDEMTKAEKIERFAEEAGKLGCYLHITSQESDALEHIMEIIGDEDKITAWDTEHIPLPRLSEWLNTQHIAIAPHNDASVEVGITGVDAALAVTGSLILKSGQGKARSSSLLPPVYIAVVEANQLVTDLESWFETLREDNFEQFRNTANVTVMSGPSKTADIGQELVKGAHGPKKVHIILIDNAQ